MNIIAKIHDYIDHDCRNESCSLPELIEKVLEADSWFKAEDALEEMFSNEGRTVSE